VNELTRRRLMHQALQVSAALIAVPKLLRTAHAADSCVEPASEGLRTSLHYAAVSPKPDEPCAACGFFSANNKPSCGQCVIMSGPVDEKGHCDSWAPKS
jgi:High potential iron-sulfur protein